MFPWAKLKRAKGAMKMHVGLDQDGPLPAFMRATDGRAMADIEAVRALQLPKGSIVVADRQRLEAHASDLNPVAVLINKAMIEIPPKFAGMPPVNPEARAQMAKDRELGKGSIPQVIASCRNPSYGYASGNETMA